MALQEFRSETFGTFSVPEVEIETVRVDIDYPQIYTSRRLLLKR
jgi:hypothetical protein